MLKIIWLNEHDYNQVLEKYLFVCTRLIENDFSVFRDLQKNYRHNPPDFAEWLSVTITNFCAESHSGTYTRKRFPKLLLLMTETEKKFFELYYWKGLPLEKIDKRFLISGNGSQGSAAEILHRIEDEYVLSGQRTLKHDQKITFIPYIEGTYFYSGNDAVNQESEVEGFLRTIFRQLPVKEQLALKLRFWEDMAPLDIADILKLSPKSRIYRILKEGLNRLHQYGYNMNQPSRNVG